MRNQQTDRDRERKRKKTDNRSRIEGSLVRRLNPDGLFVFSANRSIESAYFTVEKSRILSSVEEPYRSWEIHRIGDNEFSSNPNMFSKYATLCLLRVRYKRLKFLIHLFRRVMTEEEEEESNLPPLCKQKLRDCPARVINGENFRAAHYLDK